MVFSSPCLLSPALRWPALVRRYLLMAVSFCGTLALVAFSYQTARLCWSKHEQTLALRGRAESHSFAG